MTPTPSSHSLDAAVIPAIVEALNVFHHDNDADALDRLCGALLLMYPNPPEAFARVYPAALRALPLEVGFSVSLALLTRAFRMAAEQFTRANASRNDGPRN